jgi:hypothetical protein
MALKSTLVGNTNTTVYTSTVTGTQVGNAITSMIICNYSGGTTANLTVYAVPNNAGSVGTPGNVNMIVNALPIPAGETVSLDQEKLVLDPNDTIVAVSSQASTLTFIISTLPV